MAQNVIMLELNELCPPILERMMASGELPNFKKLHARSDVYTTWANDAEDLEPWVQWVTLHTGRTQEVHGAKELDEGYRVELPRVWDALGERGVSSLVFGSMNSRKFSDKVFLVPDPWSARVKPSDPAHMDFHHFISFFVAEHTNARAKPTRSMVMAFARYMMKHGISLSTVMSAVRQLMSEKMTGHDLKWRRSLILDLLMWDVFEFEYKRQKPMFATFFANSTAFLQHRYWRHMEPQVYTVKPSAEEMASYGDAIESSYRHMDKLVERAVRLVGPGGRIVFATALSQEANLRYEDIGGKFVYRAHDFQAMNRFAGGPATVTFEPVMTHQAWASLNSVGDADAFEAALSRLQANGENVMQWRRDGNRIFFDCKFISKVPPTLMLTNPQTGQTTPFSEIFALVGQVNNSQHNRQGAFWIERTDGQSVVHAEKLPLEQSTPLLLDLFPAEAPLAQAA